MTNKELGKEIWETIDTDYDFETWYPKYFGECIGEAAKLFDTGCCKFETGSTLEISRTISKDGNTHTFDFEKENFIEYYGAEDCFKSYTTTDDVINDLINYAAGSGKSEFYTDEQSELFAQFDQEWQALPCDPEGATPEQKEEQDDLLEEYADKIIDLM